MTNPESKFISKEGKKLAEHLAVLKEQDKQQGLLRGFQRLINAYERGDAKLSAEDLKTVKGSLAQAAAKVAEGKDRAEQALQALREGLASGSIVKIQKTIDDEPTYRAAVDVAEEQRRNWIRQVQDADKIVAKANAGDPEAIKGANILVNQKYAEVKNGKFQLGETMKKDLARMTPSPETSGGAAVQAPAPAPVEDAKPVEAAAKATKRAEGMIGIKRGNELSRYVTEQGLNAGTLAKHFGVKDLTMLPDNPETEQAVKAKIREMKAALPPIPSKAGAKEDLGSATSEFPTGEAKSASTLGAEARKAAEEGKIAEGIGDFARSPVQIEKLNVLRARNAKNIWDGMATAQRTTLVRKVFGTGIAPGLKNTDPALFDKLGQIAVSFDLIEKGGDVGRAHPRLAEVKASVDRIKDVLAQGGASTEEGGKIAIDLKKGGVGKMIESAHERLLTKAGKIRHELHDYSYDEKKQVKKAEKPQTAPVPKGEPKNYPGKKQEMSLSTAQRRQMTPKRPSDLGIPNVPGTGEFPSGEEKGAVSRPVETTPESPAPKLSSANAGKRPTKKQFGFLVNNGVDKKDIPKTRAEASAMIDRIKAGKSAGAPASAAAPATAPVKAPAPAAPAAPTAPAPAGGAAVEEVLAPKGAGSIEDLLGPTASVGRGSARLGPQELYALRQQLGRVSPKAEAGLVRAARAKGLDVKALKDLPMSELEWARNWVSGSVNRGLPPGTTRAPRIGPETGPRPTQAMLAEAFGEKPKTIADVFGPVSSGAEGAVAEGAGAVAKEAGALSKLGAGAMKWLGPLIAVWGVYETLKMLKEGTVGVADEERIKALEALSAVGGGMEQDIRGRESLRGVERMIDMAAIQRRQARDQMESQYTQDAALNALLAGQRSSLAAMSRPSQPSIAEMMARM